MESMRKRFVIARLLLLAALAGPACMLAATTTTAAPAAPEVAIGQPLRAAQLDGLNGPSRPLSSYLGRPLLINVWASWCGPCRAETASLERLAWMDPARSYAIIGISTDDDAAAARAWLAASNATISHYIDHGLQLENMLGASHLPLTVLVDARGRVLERVYGAQEWDSGQALALVRTKLAGGGHATKE